MAVTTRDWEKTLRDWSKPSSDTEEEKCERVQRMIKQAIAAYPRFLQVELKVYAKGSYANNTNVRLDSDVDVAVELRRSLYFDGTSVPGFSPGAVGVRQFTAESASATVSGSIRSEGDRVKHLDVMYSNSPGLRHQTVSRPHHGSFSYRIQGHPTSGLAGRYWTDRGTYGDTRFSERVLQRADNFEHARGMFVTSASVLAVPIGTDLIEESPS